MLMQNAYNTCKHAGFCRISENVFEKCAFAAILCAFLFAVGCGDNRRANNVTPIPGENVTPAPEENECTKDSTKCGDGADANKLYTCTDAAAYDNGVDCTANNSHRVCGGDDVKACICDAANGYIEKSGSCVCDVDNLWFENEGSCIKCDDYRFNDQCAKLQGTVKFGHYLQSSDIPEPLEWIVLDVKDNKLLLLSKYIIDTRDFDMSLPSPADPNNCMYPTWAKSEIRSWLNDSSKSGFMSAAFSDAEQAMIVEVTNSTSDYEGNDGGEDSKDKVFLLDYADTVNTDYFNDSDALLAMATAYVVTRGACVSKPGTEGCEAVNSVDICPNLSCLSEWWLRSPGRDNTDARYIGYGLYGGNIAFSSIVNMGNMGVRPALWVQAE